MTVLCSYSAGITPVILTANVFQLLSLPFLTLNLVVSESSFFDLLIDSLIISMSIKEGTLQTVSVLGKLFLSHVKLCIGYILQLVTGLLLMLLWSHFLFVFSFILMQFSKFKDNLICSFMCIISKRWDTL